jgi:hypothetical protein
MTNEPEYAVPRTIGIRLGLSPQKVNRYLDAHGLRHRGEPTARAFREGWVEAYTIQKGDRGREVISHKWRVDWVIDLILKDQEAEKKNNPADEGSAGLRERADRDNHTHN